MICRTSTTCLAAVLIACIGTPAPAGDVEPKIAAHLIPPNAEIHVSWTNPRTDPQGRKVEIVCGEVTVRRANGFDTTAFAYVVDDDKLFLSWKTDWMREPEPMGVRSVMRYCPGR
jgi:hypothetical protein